MIVVVIAVLVLFLSARGLAGFYTDHLWFNSVGFGRTWRNLLWAKFAPAAVFTILFFVMMLVSLTIADRLAPRSRAMGPEDELLARYQRSVAPYSGRIRLAVSAFFALIVGGSVAGKWREWILFTHAQSFGTKDPQFHRDVGFYVFRLPFLTFLFSWLFAALIVILIITAVAHYLNGGIRLQSPYQHVTPQVKAHLSVILALMALAKTAQYYYARFQLDFSTRGFVEGAGKTDVAAQLPALNLLLFISIIAAGLFVWNIWRRGWMLPIIAVGLWAFVSLVIGTVVPAVYQAVFVNPNTLAKEQPYIARNITATRKAFGLNQVENKPFNYSNTLTLGQVVDNLQSIDNVRLWDTDVAQKDFQSIQTLQTFYQFEDADIDRYVVDGQLKQTLISARELNSADLPSQSWVNQHIVYTHGYGAVVSAANAADKNGLPSFLTQDIPPTGSIPLSRPEVYFGESLGGYALVGAKQKELDYTRKGGVTVYSRYKGGGGVPLSSLLRRAAFALRFSDPNLLISGQITDHTRIMFLRSILDRVSKAAPFLSYDGDPYPVISNGHLVWMIDGYTTTNDYPYSQSYNANGELKNSVNYIRNSVKVTVDAYDGTIKFYVVDPKDPLIKAYRSAFPGLFTSYSKMPAALKAHLRYPQGLFRAQTDMYRSYHVTDATTFFSGDRKWDISEDPGVGLIGDTSAPETVPTTAPSTPQAASSSGPRIDPLYVLIKPPGESQVQFLLIRPFVPVSKNNTIANLAAFMIAKAEPNAPDGLETFQMPSGVTVLGPVQANSQINSTPEISRQFTLLGQQNTGSRVRQGSMQIVPIGNGLIYFRPIYVEPQNGKQPTYQFVVAALNGTAKIGTTLNEALRQFPEFASLPETATGSQVTPAPTTPPATGGGGGTTSGTLQQVLSQASSTYNQMQAALRAGNLVQYAQLEVKLGNLLNQAASRATSSGSSGTPVPLTRPPSTSPTTRPRSAAGVGA
jgi:hypothetical protein